ncbi:MAG: formylglycine-generating enzyme family protein [Betaproteobacteria bacterium]
MIRSTGSARRAAWLLLLFGALHVEHAAAEYVVIPPGKLASVLASDADTGPALIPAFAMRATPVTNGEYLLFVKSQRQWQRGKAPTSFADGTYLHTWRSPLTLNDGMRADQPVTNVSWFAAEAFCEGEGGRLPTWLEWEYVAAADETVFDARSNPAWRARILSWYSQNSSAPLGDVGGETNAYGVRNMHGLVWEWVDDFNALLVSVDSRNQGDPDKLQFCGAGAISLKDRDNYAVLMRIALLSSLSATSTTNNLGFRCVRPMAAEKK